MGGERRSANDDAKQLISITETGGNADCEFQSWPRDRQMAAYRELSKVQDPTDKIPDLVLYYGDGSGGRPHLVKKDAANQTNDLCSAPASARDRPRSNTAADQDRKTLQEYERIKRELKPQLEARERERLAHPEKDAEKLEGLAVKALDQDERARLDLRKGLEKLMQEPADYRDKVLKRMVDDGTYFANPLNGKPRVNVSYDASGKPESVEFSRYLGVDKQTIPLNKSLEQQVVEAQDGYRRALAMAPSLGKFNPEVALRAYEIQEGAEPTNLRWFMLYRKEQGRPALDPPKEQQ